MLHRKLSRVSVFLLAALAGMASDSASAGGGYPETAEEFARLPQFCYARVHQGYKEAGPQWVPKLGEACWLHLHHYCLGLNILAQQQVAAQPNAAALSMAVKDGFDYMWKQAGTGCMLIPEVLVNKGKALLLLNNPIAASESFRKSMELNQRYIPAYIELANLYTKSGQTDAARTILDYALKIDPNSKAVQRRLASLADKKKSTDSKSEAAR